MKQIFFNNWHFMRIVRLLLGIIIIVQGTYSKNWIFVIAGVLFTLLPLFNIGCCGTASCSTNTIATNKTMEETSFEEVK